MDKNQSSIVHRQQRETWKPRASRLKTEPNRRPTGSGNLSTNVRGGTSVDHILLSFLAQATNDPAHSAKLIGAGLAMGLGAIGPGIGLGIGTYGATQAIGRNPEAEGPVRTAMILGLGF